MSVDGRPVGELGPAQMLVARFAQDVATLAQSDGSSFYLRLREKFGACLASTRVPSPLAGRPCAMLLELSVQNLLLIEEARLELSGGLNVITGETGAGKTVLADALDLLLGGRARAGIVRPGADEAYVEGVFELPAGMRTSTCPKTPTSSCWRAASAPTAARAPISAGARSSSASFASWPASCCRFYGQHEHRRLMLGAAQLEILDASLGAEQALALARLRARHGRRSATAPPSSSACRRWPANASAELDLLEFELLRSKRVDPVEGERETLVAERNRLRNLEALRAAAWGAEQALADDEAGALCGARGACSSLEGASELDVEAAALGERARVRSRSRRATC